MRVLETAAENLRLFGVLFALVIGGFVALGIGLGFALMTSGALASHDDPNTIHACVKQNNGSTRIVPAGGAPDCGANEVLIEWQDAAGFADLEAQVSGPASQIADLEAENATQASQIGALETALAELNGQLPACLSEDDAGDVIFSGCNVYVNNGLDSTATTNGTGNLIIGYNEETTFGFGEERSGSHNLVVGPEHSYSSYGGFIAGENNWTFGPSSSISGGRGNLAGAIFTSVSGGQNNLASGNYSSVSGGFNRLAVGDHDWVAGSLFEDF